MEQRIAAIDIGTVTCRLLIADVADARINEVARECAIVNLGEGVDATGVLSPAAIDRTVDCLASFMHTIDAYRQDAPITVRCMATSASRDARNASELTARLAQLGLTLTVISGEKEAELSFQGASAAFPGEEVAVVDVGGGSTEIIVGQGGAVPRRSYSFNIGARRATERFIQTDPPSADDMKAIHDWCRPVFESFFAASGVSGTCHSTGNASCSSSDGTGMSNKAGTSDGVSAPSNANMSNSVGAPDNVIVPPQRLIAVAGTATTAVSVADAMEAYDSSRVHGREMKAAELDNLIDRLAALNLAEREEVVGLQPQRAPIIVAGLLILSDAVHAAGTGSFIASESDILAGIIMDTACRSS